MHIRRFALLFSLVLLVGLSFAHAETESGIEYLEVGDKAIHLKDDFSVRAVLQRKAARSALDGSINFYANGNTDYTLVIRWLKPDSCELYLEKYVNGKYMGYMIAEEFKGIQKTTYPTTYYGWDVTTEKDLELILTVQDGFACITLNGAVTGMSESLHFDLSKSPILNKKAAETNPVQLTSGQLKYSIRGGSFTSFEIDADTFNGKKAALPEEEWMKAKRENRRASTPLGSLAIGNFTAGKYIHNGTVLPYQIYLPENYEAGKKYPVMLFLHGADMRGTDNEKSITSGDFTLCHKMIEEKRECIIVAPQTPDFWVQYEPDRTGNIRRPRGLMIYDEALESEYLKAVLAMIDEMKETNFVDETKVYVSGYSMGGHGSLYLLAAYPDTFAAGIIFCGTGSIEKAEAIAKTPLYIYHGNQDTLVSYNGTKALADAVADAGGDVTFYSVEGYGHGLFVPIRMDNTVLDWLFSHTKAQPAQ